jgi:hypothetical protein
LICWYKGLKAGASAASWKSDESAEKTWDVMTLALDWADIKVGQ